MYESRPILFITSSSEIFNTGKIHAKRPGGSGSDLLLKKKNNNHH